MDLVVRDRRGAKLSTDAVFERLWTLQRELEDDPSVGTVISLPIIMAEADRAPLSFLLTWEGLLEKLEEPEYDRVAQSFINEERTLGHFVLRMKESGRKESRQEIVNRIRTMVEKHDFVVVLVGGLYHLQGQLAQRVQSSIVLGVGALMILFSVVALVATRSLRTALSMILSFSIVPICLFGITGRLGMPLDIISAPATNVAMAIGIDDLIHLTILVRRRRKDRAPTWHDWVEARRELYRPILSSSLIVIMGFSIFFLSAFPPTQRLGFSVVVGTILAVVVVLLVFPLIADWLNTWKRNTITESS